MVTQSQTDVFLSLVPIDQLLFQMNGPKTESGIVPMKQPLFLKEWVKRLASSVKQSDLKSDQTAKLTYSHTEPSLNQKMKSKPGEFQNTKKTDAQLQEKMNLSTPELVWKAGAIMGSGWVLLGFTQQSQNHWIFSGSPNTDHQKMLT